MDHPGHTLLQALLGDVPEWRARAACLGLGPDVFFEVMSAPARDRARGVCSRCPVAEECGEGAIARGERYGLWAGMTANEITEVRRARRRTAA